MPPVSKTVFVCQQCAYKSPKWIGKCPSCGAWNSFSEEIVLKKTDLHQHSGNITDSELIDLADVNPLDCERIILPFVEFNRVLGGGLVKGSVLLLGGEPGVGKSTLMLQTALQLDGLKILYVSGEESPGQIRLRASRFVKGSSEILLYSGTIAENIIAAAEKIKPDIVVVDSIQTVYTDQNPGSPGTVGQIRACAQLLQRFAKQSLTPVILIGHITREGNIAGPMALEHIVDVVLQFEGDNNHYYRLLRTKKNRFGSASELGVFEMDQKGLIEVNDPGNILLPDDYEGASGTAITAMNEGSRTLMIEVQALAGNSVYSSPQRITTGFDTRRLHMIIAVLEKRMGYRLGQKDIFLNIAGGIRLTDPAADLAVLTAILSSLTDIAVDASSCFIGEISLSGQVRPVSNIQMRISEVIKLGFKKVYLSKYQQHLDTNINISVERISGIKEVAKKVFSA
ncbi:MAG TPA: DNA repair protein RadA [Bacteroidales bacterium]|nr:DNA repair protein RadA [Bacteroidales bacterium]